MTSARATAATAARRWWPLAVGLLVLVVVAVAVGPRQDSGIALDPRSTGPLGTRAVLDVLRELGVEVDLDVAEPGAQHDVALLLIDDLDDPARDALQGWVEAGGRLVVADASSTLTPEVVGTTAIGFTDPTIRTGCDLPLLRDVDRVDASGGAVYDPGGASSCFLRGDGAWLVVTHAGAGAVIALGGPSPFVNAALGTEDDALLAAALLGGDGPGSALAVVVGGRLGGTRPLADLLPRGVVPGLWQLALGFVVVAWWRARRLGRPVAEPLPVVIPGSETVRAGGRLLERGGARGHAAAVLRDDLRGALVDRLGLPPDSAADPAVVAQAAATRTGVPRERVLAALAGPTPASDDDLAHLAAEVAAVRRACLGATR